MDQLLSVLPTNNAWMPFEDFVQAAREVGANPALWRRAKLAGKIEARISESGVHEIRLAVSNAS